MLWRVAVLYSAAMPPQQQPRNGQVPGRGRLCSALTTGGRKCQRQVVPGLTVCKSHGGGTAASVRSGKVAVARSQAAALWGVSSDAGSISVEAELTKLARNKMTDVLALRLKISADQVGRHIGTLTDSFTETEYDIEGTVQSKSGTQTSRVKKAGTSVWVQELHRTEMELVQILKLLQEVTGGTEEVDTQRLRMQTAREAARLITAFPGMTVDQVALEVAKRAS